ncbi:MAG: membrane protein insertion efficiency factor YidD [Rhodospirillales bacterium CG15_BIG_FIL_POST_REV_8_21_14_020_66_15]|nr:MAG: membrane protein insertion efficiency factor YidD [Rhodospirillales bacterium CG15_BIG_FIL_POST_REV_8_21_14_020_66_15]
MAPTITALPAHFARALVRGYQLFLSPLAPASCRFHPTCSEYARDAFLHHGFRRGLGLALWRVLRCNPWNRGGVDPVPAARQTHGHDHGRDRRHFPQPHGS